jgi:hypothetical protein
MAGCGLSFSGRKFIDVMNWVVTACFTAGYRKRIGWEVAFFMAV